MSYNTPPLLLSLSLLTPTRRPYSIAISTPSSHATSTESLRGPCQYATPLRLTASSPDPVLHLQHHSRSRSIYHLSTSDLYLALHHQRPIQIQFQAFHASIFVERDQPELATLAVDFDFSMRILANSWRFTSPNLEGTVYVRRPDGAWRCVYRKGRCIAGTRVYWYGRETIEGLQVKVEGLCVKNGEVLFGGGALIDVQQGANAIWKGGQVSIRHVEGKALVHVDIDLFAEAKGWWRRLGRRRDRHRQVPLLS